MAAGERKTLSLPVKADPDPSRHCTKRELLEKQLTAMKEVRRPYEAEIYEIAGLAQPNRSRYVAAMSSRSARSQRRANKLYDGHAIRSFRTLTGGMYSGMSSPNRPWAKFTFEDKDLATYQPVKVWLEQASEIVLRMLNSSNFYAAAKLGYSEIGLFGTDACVMTEALDWETGLTYPVCFSQTFGEYWVALNHKLEPDRLIRQQMMTVKQMVGAFVADRLDKREMRWDRVSVAVQNAWDRGNYETEIPTYHAIRPNENHIPGRMDPSGMPWESVKWEEGQADKGLLLEEKGYWSQPFWAPRWEVASGDVYGFGPGHDALTDMRALQLQAKRKGEATDFAVKPPLMAPASLRIKFQPGSVTHAAAADQAQVKPIFQVDYRAIEVIGRDAAELRDAVDEATYARLFMAISSLDGSADRTVMEIAKREEEKLTQLGPVIERVNNEKLAVALDRAFDIAARNSMLPDPPEEIQDMPIEIDFVSILAQAQRMIGMQQTERALGFTAQLANAKPEVLDNLDGDALMRDYWDRAGAPALGLKDERARDQDRAARAQQARMEKAAAMAPAMQQGAEAARTMAETPVRGGQSNLFDSLMQQPPI